MTVRTTARVNSCERDPPLIDKAIYHEKNRGKGAALRTGIAAATGDIIISGRRSRVRPARISPSGRPILRDEADVVFGSRFMGGARTACSISGTGRQWPPDAAFQHAHQPEPDGHGNRVQSIPARNHQVDQHRGKPISVSSRKSPQKSRTRAAASMRSVFHTAAGLTRREKRSTGRMGFGRFIVSSNIICSADLRSCFLGSADRHVCVLPVGWVERSETHQQAWQRPDVPPRPTEHTSHQPIGCGAWLARGMVRAYLSIMACSCSR